MNFPGKKIIPRYFVVTVVLSLLGVSVIGRAAWIMFAERDYWMAIHNRFVTDSVPIEPSRGNIYSADGQLLASTLPEYKLYMDFMSAEKNEKRRIKDQARRDSLLRTKMDSICQGMHRIFPDIDPVEFRKLLEEGRRQESHNWLLYDRRVSYVDYKRAKELPLFRLSPYRGGFHVTEYKHRVKPFGSLASRTIGTMYGGKDTARFGLELSFDSVLRGKQGVRHRQKVMNKYLNIVDQPAEDGCDIVTTLDVGMQDVCEKALNDKLTEINANSGVCILMEVATGDIKAMTSLTKCADGKYREIRNSAVSNLMEPGSVFKTVSFMVAMDDGYIDMNTSVDVGGGIMIMYNRKMRDHNWRSGGYGLLTASQILERSSNCGVSYLIDKYYKDDPGKFVDGVYRTGIAEDFHLPIPGYAKAQIRHPKPDGSNWSRTALPWMSIGYETQIPPISTLTFYNGIANGGKMMQPRLVKAVQKNGQTIREYPPVVVRERMCKPQTLTNLQTILERVVRIGLGKKAGSRNFHTSGKTGTAQVWTKAGFASQYLVSFVGYFPSERPKYSCIVCIQKAAPASGGGHCGPVFRRVAETLMAREVQPDYSSARDTLHSLLPDVLKGNIVAARNVLGALGLHCDAPATPSSFVWGKAERNGQTTVLSEAENGKDVVPDVKGAGLRDAVFMLERLGLRVKASGVGKVSHQDVAPGSPIHKGQVVHLVLENSAAEKSPRISKPAPVRKDTAQTLNPEEEVVANVGDGPQPARQAETDNKTERRKKSDASSRTPSEKKKSKPDAVTSDDRRSRKSDTGRR